MGIKKGEIKKFELVLAEKIEIFALVSFVFSLFLLDVNANIIGAYGNHAQVNLLFGRTIAATLMFWIGITFFGFCLLLLGTRTKYHPKRNHKKMDFFMSIIGIIGMMIILSGGMLMFWHNNSLLIPFFKWEITRISYYHIGIVLEILTAFYFGLVK